MPPRTKKSRIHNLPTRDTQEDQNGNTNIGQKPDYEAASGALK